MTAEPDSRKADRHGARPHTVLGALFDPLDPETERRFGIGDPSDTAGDDGNPAAPRTAQPHERAKILAPKAPDVRLRDFSRHDYLTVAKTAVAQIGEDRVTSVAGGVTFFGLLSLFPSITAFVSLYGLLADPQTIESHIALLEDFVPAGGLDIIRSQVTTIASGPSGALSLAGIAALLVAFWSANGGMKALLSALNVAFYQHETRSFVRLNLVAMAFTLSGLLVVALMLSVIAVIPAILHWLPLGPESETLINVTRWPIMFAVLVTALAAIYRFGPAAPRSRWRWISPGAVLAAVALVITSMVFSFYTANFADYNETYGSLGAVIALMIWLWLAATVVLAGAEINSALERHMKRMAGLRDPESEIQAPA